MNKPLSLEDALREIAVRKILRDTRAAMIRLAVDAVPGSYAKGTRIKKKSFVAGDTFPAGTGGRVLGVMREHIGDEFGYFVEWDPLPGVPVFTRGSKLELAGG